MNKVLFFVVGLFAFSSCGEGQGILSESKMADVLRDIHMTDGVLNGYGYNFSQHLNVDSTYIYKTAFQKNDVTREEFVNSLQYYAKFPKRIDRIYARVINDLSAYQEEEKKKYNKDNKKTDGKKQNTVDKEELAPPLPQ